MQRPGCQKAENTLNYSWFKNLLRIIEKHETVLQNVGTKQRQKPGWYYLEFNQFLTKKNWAVIWLMAKQDLYCVAKDSKFCVTKNAERLISSFVTSHMFLTIVKTALPKQNLFSFSFTGKVRQNSFSFPLTDKVPLLMLQPNVTLVLILSQMSLMNSIVSLWTSPFIHSNSCILICDSNISTWTCSCT